MKLIIGVVLIAQGATLENIYLGGVHLILGCIYLYQYTNQFEDEEDEI